MSRENYIRSLDVSNEPFEVLIMAFMRIADEDNLKFLMFKYPHIWAELKARYNASGGYLEGEK